MDISSLIGHLHLNVSENKLVTLSRKQANASPLASLLTSGMLPPDSWLQGTETQQAQMRSNGNLWPRVMNLPEV